MPLLLLAVGVLVGSGALALLAARSRWGSRLGASGAVAGCALAIIPAVRVLAGSATESLRVGWQVPYGAFFVEIDALSAFFLVPILSLSALAAVYGAEYLRRIARRDGWGPRGSSSTCSSRAWCWSSSPATACCSWSPGR